MIKALVFDFDGLILDTETAEYETFREVYRRHGQDLPLDVWGKWIGTDGSGFNPYDHLDELVGQPLVREDIRNLRKETYDMLMQNQDIRPGVREMLQSAQELGLRIGLASSASREWVTGYLSQYGIIDYFGCIWTRDDVAHAKPDPELYLRALESLGAAPSEAIAFEDSPNGALAAKRAGMHCVIVPNPTTDQLLFGEHDARLSSMLGVDLQSLIASLKA